MLVQCIVSEFQSFRVFGRECLEDVRIEGGRDAAGRRGFCVRSDLLALSFAHLWMEWTRQERLKARRDSECAKEAATLYCRRVDGGCR
jgi:hypothetical protein